MKRIKYLSRHERKLSQPEIEELVERAARKNRALEITGIFMSVGEIFFQVIEGPTAHVDELFEQIMADPRHRDVLLLQEEEGVDTRFFPDWSMRKIDLDRDAYDRLDPVRGMLETVIEKRQELDRLVLSIEKAVWYELATALDEF